MHSQQHVQKRHNKVTKKLQSTGTLAPQTDQQTPQQGESPAETTMGALLRTLEDNYDSLDWDSLSKTWSWIIVIFLNLTMMGIKFMYHFDHTEISSDEKRLVGKSTFTFTLELFEYALLLVSCYNSFCLLMYTKKYRLFQHQSLDPPMTSNAQLVDVNPAMTVDSLYHRIYKYFLGSSFAEDQDKVWEIDMWDPQIFTLNLFRYFSPPQVMVLLALDSENWYYYLPIAIFVGVQVTTLVNAYSSYIKDKQVLFGEVVWEYDHRFVYPTIFKQTREVGTQTDLPTAYRIP